MRIPAVKIEGIKHTYWYIDVDIINFHGARYAKSNVELVEPEMLGQTFHRPYEKWEIGSKYSNIKEK